MQFSSVPLTDKDLEAIAETPFLRVDKDSYKALCVALVFVLFLVLMAPVLGPRVKPVGWEQPKTLVDYFSRLWPYAIILLVMTIPPLTDLIIRGIEVKVGTKKAKRMVVKRKLMTKKWTLIIFEPFHISVFKYFFRLRCVKPGDILIAEVSAMKRIIDFEKEYVADS